MRPFWAIFVGLLFLIGAGSAFLSYTEYIARNDSQAQLQFPDLEVLGTAPSFSFMSSAGRKFSREELNGKLWVVNFFFTSCPHICPTINGRVAGLVNRFADTDVHFVSLTVNPEKDTVPILAEYALRYKADTSKWHFLRGEMDQVISFMREGFKLGSGELPEVHTTRLALVDREGNIRGYYNGLDSRSVSKLSDNLDTLLEEASSL